MRLTCPSASHSPELRGWQGRRAYTLLELILALAIGLVLLAGLYLTLSTQVRQSQSAREIVEDGTLARAILTRIGNDILGHLGPIDAKVLPDPFDSSASEGGKAEPPTNTGGAASNGTPSGGTTSGGTGNDAGETQPKSMSASGSDAVRFNIGVYGDAGHLMLAASRVPRELNLTGALGAGVRPQLVSDLRRVSYWVASDGGEALGLARQELTRITGQEIDTRPWENGNARSLIIAPEVKSITFQFFDGASWQSTWDGTEKTGLLETYLGPPAAIAINLELRRFYTEDGEKKERVSSYRHVVPIPAGNNYTQSAP